MRPHLAMTEPNWHVQRDFNEDVLGPWHVWSTTAAENPVGTAALAWTGSSVDPAIGDGTLTGQWRELGDLVWLHIYLLIGSTTTNGTGNWRFSLPFAAHGLAPQVVPGCYHAVGAGARSPLSGFIAASGTIIAQVDYAGGSLTDAAPVYAAGDHIVLEGFYRPA